ncbi:uncharacterized protein LOC131848960 [Achroia grisella]|uniref:uncharacterized protein LOC131848960 n=1 Tax=Achroia grisella TaxID=688607 RepID=UPI0027D219EF|nr:uncharacterized protein LOC131848960 [Achroia grisella]
MSIAGNDSLKLKLLAATRRNLYKQKDVCKLRNMEHLFSEEIDTISRDLNFVKQQLEMVLIKVSQCNHQLSMIDICITSEMTKITAQMNNIRNLVRGFDELFVEECRVLENYQRELREKEAAEQEAEKQKEKEAAKNKKQRDKDVAAIEHDCEAIEQECVVLKKRNNAVMLKLKRKLIETENTRRDLLKKKQNENQH